MSDVRERYAEYREALELARLSQARDGDDEGLRAVDRRFDDLASGDGLEELRADLADATLASTRESAARLLRLCERAALEATTRDTELELAAREREQELRVGRRVERVRRWRTALTDEPDAERRAEIQAALDAADAALNGLREELWARRSEACAELGYATPAALAAAERGDLDLDAWAGLAEEFLARTEAAQRDAARALLGALGLPASAAHAGDWARAETLPRHARVFPPERLSAAVAFALAGYGVPWPPPGVAVALAPELAGAFVAAPRPGAIALVWAPVRGVAGHALWLHAGGRAAAAAYASAELPVEQRHAADGALAGAWGELLSARLADAEWLEETPVGARAAAIAADARLRRLGRLRRTAALVRVELELARLPGGADPSGLAGRCAEAVGEALGVRWPAERYLLDATPALGALDRLRGAALEAQLAEALRTRYARRFWRERACGELLKELWHTGATYRAQDLAADLDLGALGVDALVDSCRAI